MPRTHFFRYLQVRNFVRTKSNSFPSLPQELQWESLFELSPTQKGLISVIYQRIMSLNNETLPKLKSKWEGELGMVLAADWWTLALARVNSTSSCARLSLIQLKVVHRAHFSKSKLHEIYPDVTAIHAIAVTLQRQTFHICFGYAQSFQHIGL